MTGNLPGASGRYTSALSRIPSRNVVQPPMSVLTRYATGETFPAYGAKGRSDSKPRSTISKLIEGIHHSSGRLVVSVMTTDSGLGALSIRHVRNACECPWIVRDSTLSRDMDTCR